MVHGHAASFGAAELGEDGPNGYIGDDGGIEGGIGGEGRAEDVVEEFFGIGVLEVPFV